MAAHSHIPLGFCSDRTNFSGELLSLQMGAGGETTPNMRTNFNGAASMLVPLMDYEDVNSPASESAFYQQLCVPQFPRNDTGFRGFVGFSHQYKHQVFEHGDEEWSSLVVQNFCPDNSPLEAQNWAFESGNLASKIEDSEVKVGRYSVEERKDRILRYLKKRNKRNFKKTIKYACRKTLADKRVRIRGRFAKNQESGEEYLATNTMSPQDCPYGQSTRIHSLYEDSYFQMRTYEDEEDWLQTAMANFVHLPYINS